jgi:hypothetical protein
MPPSHDATLDIKPLKIDRLAQERSALLWLQIVMVTIALIARLLPGPRTIDDSYITFRYARNLLGGEGFVFNPGERVLGTTTPLYTLLLGSLGFFDGGQDAPFPQIAWLVNALADAATCLLLFHLGRRLDSWLGGLGAALVWAVAPFSVTFAIGGLETSLYVLLLVGMVYAHVTQRHIAAAFLASLSLLTRPDALILIGPLFLDRFIQVIRHRGDQSLENKTSILDHPLTLESLAFLVPAAIWIIFASAYFGSPIPHSILAKSLAYRLPQQAGFIRLLQHYATPFMDQATLGVVGIGMGMLVYPFLFLIGALHSLRRTARIWPFLAYPWLYFAVFALANPLIFRWYLTPPLPPYILAILIGADRLARGIIRWRAAPQPDSSPSDEGGRYNRLAQAGLVLFVIAIPVLLSLGDWRLRPDHGLRRPSPNMAWYQLELLYRQAAATLANEIGEQPARVPLLAAGDVGVLGFFTPARILDTVGLNSPLSTQYYPLDPQFYAINYAVPPQLILDARPDYLVILEVYGRLGLLKESRFWQEYELLQKIPTDIYGSDGMLIFTRRPPP